MEFTKEEFIEKILIDFLSFLNENGYINDYDFVYETQVKKFIKQIKTNKMEKETIGNSNNNNTLLSHIYSKNEVKSIIQSIYSEFAELPSKMHTTRNLRDIIEQEVEQHQLKPIKIFK